MICCLLSVREDVSMMFYILCVTILACYACYPYPPSLHHLLCPVYVREQDCYEILGGMASDWKVLASHLVNNEDVIDEVDCNNSSDFGCLHDFLILVVKHRSRAEIAEALEKMGLQKEAKAVLQLPSISMSTSHLWWALF